VSNEDVDDGGSSQQQYSSTVQLTRQPTQCQTKTSTTEDQVSKNIPL